MNLNVSNEEKKESPAFRWGRGGGEANLHEASLSPVPMENLLSLTVSKISSGANHTILLTDVGKVYGYGDNSMCQLGQPSSQVNRLVDPTEIPFFGKMKGIEISCGENSASVIVEGGDVYSFGDNSQINHLESLKRRYIKQLTYALGKHVGLSERGESFFWKTASEIPEKEEFLCKLNASHLSGSFARLLVLTQEGEVYEGIYDHFRKTISWSILHKRSDLEHKIVEVSSKGNVRLALDETGNLYSSEIPSSIFIKISCGLRFTQISTGRRHCAALTHEGKLYTWGDNNQGQLGHGDTQKRTTPELVKDIWQYVYSILLNGDESIAVVSVPQSRLGEELFNLFRGGERTDITFSTLEGANISAHRAIIKIRCPKLREMIQEGEGPVKLNMKESTLSHILVFLYSDRTIAPKYDEIEDIIQWAKDLELKKLIRLLSFANVKIESITLKEDILRLVDNPMDSDFKLCIKQSNEDFIYVHRCLLERSIYFRKLLRSGMKEAQQGYLNIDFSKKTVVKLVEWIYVGEVTEMSVDIALELIQASNEYAAEESLKELCSSIIMKEMEMETVCYVYEIAKFSSSPRLLSACLEMIIQKYQQIKETKTFKNLTEDSRKEIQDALKLKLDVKIHSNQQK